MITAHQQLGIELAKWVKSTFPDVQIDEQQPSRVLVSKNESELACLELTPVATETSKEDLSSLFSTAKTIDDIIDIYRQLKTQFPFEEDIPVAMDHVHPYATYFIDRIFSQARAKLDQTDAALIINWIKNLDAYTCVKAIESLFYSKADLQLLAIAEKNQWQVHFDHLAIRCGNQSNKDAERIVEFLQSEHGYSQPQIADQDYYEFSDGWNAYVLFKMLANGQSLLLFIDQSDISNPQQVIQHWNRVYGYTPHHLAIRLTQRQTTNRVALALTDVISVVTKANINVLQPTGLYTHQMLEQVFTKPEQNKDIPADLIREINQRAPQLAKVLENGKLLEIVSRLELPAHLKQRWFALYNIEYQSDHALHSAPLYSYFLPAQAAHVIRTSIQT